MLFTWVIERTVKFPIIYIIGDDKIWTSLRQNNSVFGGVSLRRSLFGR